MSNPVISDIDTQLRRLSLTGVVSGVAVGALNGYVLTMASQMYRMGFAWYLLAGPIVYALAKVVDHILARILTDSRVPLVQTNIRNLLVSGITNGVVFVSLAMLLPRGTGYGILAGFVAYNFYEIATWLAGLRGM